MTELNHPRPDDPGSTAVHGGGVGLHLVSKACARVEVHDAPADFPGAPGQEARGNAHVCSGCLEPLLP